MSELRIGSLPAAVSALAARRVAAATEAPTAAASDRPVRGGAAAAAFGADSFVDTLGRALDYVNHQQVRAERTASALARGRPVDMIQAVVQIEQASISLQFAIQVRNKLLEAYQEIMRMQV